MRIIILCAIVIFIFSLVTSAWADLFQYVQKPDEAFKWEKKEEVKLKSGTSGFEIDMTSQRWMDITWKHRLKIVKPRNVKNKSTALIYITGSGKGEKEWLYSALIAKSTGILSCVLHDIPNQPLFGDLREDGLISYTFEQYLKDENEEWPALFPMVKGVVRAMDVIQEFADKEFGLKIDSFILMGASKRGWTTWLTAVADSRVKGIIPMVYDNLNINPQMKHQKDTWGAYSEQISEYTEKGLQEKIDRGPGKRLIEMVDPYTWSDTLVLPKLIINGTNDKYWVLDALNLYWDNLKGGKYILYVANSGHKLEDWRRVLKDVVAFCHMVTGYIKFPDLDWKFKKKDGRVCLNLTSDIKPKVVRVWAAMSGDKDFRDARWESSLVRKTKQGYTVEVNLPEEGYMAVFGEATYRVYSQRYCYVGRHPPRSKPLEFSLSTNVHITRGGKAK